MKCRTVNHILVDKTHRYNDHVYISFFIGIEYNPDELCEQKAGAGFKFRAFPYDWVS